MLSVLKTDERAREDDFYLYGRVLDTISPKYSDMTISEFCNVAKVNRVTPFESVRRCRAKIQSEREDLKPSIEVQRARKENEKIMKSFALN